MQLFLADKYFPDKCFVWAGGLGHPPPLEKMSDFPENHVLGASDGPWPGTLQAGTGPVEAWDSGTGLRTGGQVPGRPGARSLEGL